MQSVPESLTVKPGSRANASAGGKRSATVSGGGETARTELSITAAERIDAWTGDPSFMTSLARGIAVIRPHDSDAAQASARTGWNPARGLRNRGSGAGERTAFDCRSGPRPRGQGRRGNDHRDPRIKGVARGNGNDIAARTRGHGD